ADRTAARAPRPPPLRPALVDRRNEPPRLLDLVRAREQRRVTAERVEKQAPVGLRRALAERLTVEEVHRDLLEVDAHSRTLAGERETDPLVRLDAHDEQVGARVRRREVAALLALAEEEERRLLELDRDLRHAPREALS